MNPETTFRAVLGVGFLAVLVIMLFHRLRSWTSNETLDRRQEGLFVLATLRPVGLVLWVRVGLFAFGVGLLTWTLRALGTNLTDTVVTRRAHTLVTHGPYRWVRHPFYDAMALLSSAIALIAANWFLLVTGAVVFVLLAVRSRTEDAKLLARFGEPYRAYQRNTGRFVPRLRQTKRDA